MRGKSTSFSAVLILIWTHICMNRLAMMNDFPIFPSLLALWYFPSICTFCKNRKDVYKRQVCGWVYDPAEGDPEGGIAPGTAFEDIPDDWVCPLCGVGKDDFEVQED